jgi:hypothetical protein
MFSRVLRKAFNRKSIRNGCQKNVQHRGRREYTEYRVMRKSVIDGRWSGKFSYSKACEALLQNGFTKSSCYSSNSTALPPLRQFPAVP